MSKPRIGFEMEIIRLSLDAIFPIRQIKDPDNYKRFPSIFCSVKEVGVIEPLIVVPLDAKAGTYKLMDGHLRYISLRRLNQTEVDCLISTDDESFTYNAKISRLSPIQEHQMITKAVKNGVNPERIATALNLDLKHILSSLNLLDGIHPEAVDLLKDKNICPKAIAVLKRVSQVRQIEMAELMVSVNNFSHAYADALLMGTVKEHLLQPDKPKLKSLMSPEEVARMESEMESLEHDFKAIEESYGGNMLNLTLARGYVKKLLENAKIVRYLSSHHQDIFSEFEATAATEVL